MQGRVAKGQATTGADGRYLIDNLAPGIYDLKVVIPHFDVDYSMQTITVRAQVESAEHNLTRSMDWAPGKLIINFNPGVQRQQCEGIIEAFSCSIDSYAYYFDFNSNTIYAYTVTIPDNKTPVEMQEVFSSVAQVANSFFEAYFSSCWLMF
jgi:hypothetical protein